jgi:hypothetical protein
MDLKSIRFGIEIETVKQTREKVARAIQSVVGGTVQHIGMPQCHDPWEVTDARGRKWKVVADGSLTNVDAKYRAEIVSPILVYGDIEELQDVVRAVRAAGGRANSQCGIHIHLDAAAFTTKALVNLAKIVNKQEDLIVKALDVNDRRLASYAKKVSGEFIEKIEKRKPKTNDELNKLWYGYQNSNPTHYDSTRYRALNYHNIFYRNTVEMRWFNGCLHAGKIRAYVQFCLALGAKAINSNAASSRKRDLNPISSKFDFRVFLIGLGMVGDEFKTARYHLLANLEGDSAFKNGRPQTERVA